MLRRRIYLVTMLFVALIVGCTQDVSGRAELRNDAEQFVPPDATQKTVAPGLPWVQISFNVRRPWLQFAFDENRIRNAQLAGWKLCQPLTDKWEGYEDRAVTPAKYRRQRTYLLYKDGVSMQFFGLYDTPLNTAGNRDEFPVQLGIIVARKEKKSEALQIAQNFHLSCDTTAVSH